MKKFGRSKPRYSEGQKQRVVEEILSQQLNVQESSRHYQIPSSTIFRWLDKHTNSEKTNTFKKLKEKGLNKEELSKEDYESKIELLEKALSKERYKTAAYKTMIEIAEAEFSISIKKKSGTKQLKK